MQSEGGDHQASREAFASRDPFAGFGFGRSRSLMSSLFGMGGFKDPFDDPFFTRPIGSVFGSSVFDPVDDDDAAAAAPAGKGVVIKELNSDGEEEEDDKDIAQEQRENKSSDVIRKSDHEKNDEETKAQVKSQSFSYRKVTYGGVDGAYRTTMVSKRTGSDGVVLEESYAADKTTGQAQHRISKGIQHKGHSVTRMLKPDGKVETVQTLHNLNEDELAGFEQSWKGNAGKHIGGEWKDKEMRHFPGAGSRGWDSSLMNRNEKTVAVSRAEDGTRTSSSNVRAKKVVRIPIE